MILGFTERVRTDQAQSVGGRNASVWIWLGAIPGVGFWYGRWHEGWAVGEERVGGRILRSGRCGWGGVGTYETDSGILVVMVVMVVLNGGVSRELYVTSELLHGAWCCRGIAWYV